MPDQHDLSPVLPEWDDVPEVDDAEPADAESDHTGHVDVDDEPEADR